MPACPHIEAVEELKVATKEVCETCVTMDATWVHLRTCQECGVTLCCDSSPNKHASAHARSAKHPVITSAQPGERWIYCFVDDAFGEY